MVSFADQTIGRIELNQRELIEIISKFNLMAQEIEKREQSLNEMNRELITAIAEHQQTVKALRESEFRFRSFFNSSSHGIVISDLSGRILDGNKRLEKMTGYLLDSPCYPVFAILRQVINFLFSEKSNTLLLSCLKWLLPLTNAPSCLTISVMMPA